MTPLGALARGLVAGIAGTAAMTAYQELVAKIRGGESKEPTRWVDTPVPAQLGKRIVEGVLDRKVTLKDAPLLTNAMHWGYGVSWGGIYGLVQESIRANAAADGAALGTALWGSSYIAMPAIGLQEQIWKYPPKELAIEFSYHLVYGLGVAAAYRALDDLL